MSELSIPVLMVPFLNRPDLLCRLVDSIDFPVDQFVVVDNSHDTNWKSIRASKGVYPKDRNKIMQPNAGVAASWNQVIKQFPASWWLLVNNDIEFAPGDLEKMAVASAQHPGVGCLYGNHGASFWAVTAHGINTVGLFDENFYPAYCEDCDWSTRADLLGVERKNVPFIKSRHGDDQMTGSCTIYSDPVLRAKNGHTHQGNMDYYVAKWGGSPGKETYETPFNAGGPVDVWRFDTKRRATQLW